ncbi:pentatricopeptide repeat-containing protein At3g29230-like [Rhododendron vialii]|uniref:pentatricopeptide repeat-containing protein At3g29230-like n=1 Tax=Rhododendron vialii TaxID=182163 RepID=UPI00265DE2C1|nr:pentatricopeptide repeat-containing protein At3g29230-like [Rhododendron vialii]
MNSIPRPLPSLATDYLTFVLSTNNLLNLRQLQQIHGQLLTSGRLSSTPLLTTFLTSYYRTHKTNHYPLLFLRNLPKPNNPFLWNSMVQLSLQSENWLDFLGFYNGLRENYLFPNKSLVSLIFRACAGLCATHLGESFRCQLLKMGILFDVVLQTGLIDFYAKVGDLRSAEKVFEEMTERDVVANNVMLSGFTKHGFVEEARRLFDSMQERDSCSWNSMITCYCKLGQIDSARLMFDRSPVKDVVSWNAIIDGYCKLGQLMNAEELFVRMGSVKNSVTWNTMIAGYVQSREFGRAMRAFQQMQAQNVKPTEVTMVSLLSACAHLGAVDMGEWIHAYIRSKNFKVDVVLGNALIDMYCKCGSIEAALDVFHGLTVKNTFCWNSVIVGLGMHGYGEEAVNAFIAMEKENLKPDEVTFVGLLSGCSHSGLVSAGRRYFSHMSSVFGIQPGIEHYGCMVDLLGRAGLLQEALDVIKTMPMKPNSVVWGTLLRACRVHKDTKFIEQVTQYLLELETNDEGNYVVLSNLYASLNRWDDVNFCRKLMTQRGVRKTPGCSSIEVDNLVHEFVAGDPSRPEFSQFDVFSDEIQEKLKGNGHEPDKAFFLHDIDEEEKESII